MKRIIHIAFLLLAYYNLSAQCPDIISLSTQSEVDGFAEKYPSCTKVQRLSLVGNDISNLHGLSQIKEIRDALFIFYTKITTVEGLNVVVGKDASVFVAENTNLSDIGGLEYQETIHQITLEGSVNLSDISSLESVEHYSSIELSNLGISDLSALKSLKSVKKIVIRDNPSLVNINQLKEVDSISYFELNNNPQLEEASIFTNVEKIDYLLMEQNSKLTNLSGLEKLQELDSLVISGNALKSLEPFKSLKKLSSVFFKNTQLEDFTGLENIKELKELIVLNNAELEDISGLSQVQSIHKKCYIVNNPKLKYCESLCAGLSSTPEVQLLGNEASCNQLSGFNCLNHLKGVFYYDENQNKIKDVNEVGLSNQLAYQSEFGFWQLTDSNGHFFLPAKVGENYSIQPKINTDKWLLTTDSQSFNIQYDSMNPLTQNLNFGLFPVQKKHKVDVFILPNVDTRRNGTFQILCKNNGAFVESGQLTLSYEPEKLEFEQSFPSPKTIDEEKGVVTWEYHNLQPFSSYIIEATLPYSYNSDGSPQKITAEIFRDSLGASVYGTRATHQLEFQQINSYGCSLFAFPYGEGDEHFIPKDTTLTYCQNIELFDRDLPITPVLISTTFDSHLDINTFEIVHSNTVIPPAIKLVDGNLRCAYISVLEPVNNMANFTFQMHTKPDVPANTTMSTSFSGYCRSNKLLQTIVSDPPKPFLTGNENDDLVIAPNPASTYFRVKTKPEKQPYWGLVIYDSLGKIVKTQYGFDMFKEEKIDISNFPTGIYLVKLIGGSANKSGKLVVFR